MAEFALVVVFAVYRTGFGHESLFRSPIDKKRSSQ